MGVRPRRAPCRGVSVPTPKTSFSKTTQAPQAQAQAQVQAYRRIGVQAYRRAGAQAQGLGLGCLVFNF